MIRNKAKKKKKSTTTTTEKLKQNKQKTKMLWIKIEVNNIYILLKSMRIYLIVHIRR